MIQVGVLGSTGRMGQEIIALLENHATCQLSAAGTRKNASSLFPLSDVLIDFTSPEALPLHLDLSLQHKNPLVVGTTGLTTHHHQLISTAAKHIPLFVSANMSFGIALLKQLTQKTAEILDNSFDIEISEIHHRHKKDAPSGTALMLGEAAAKARQKHLSEIRVQDGHLGGRKSGTIGFSAQRGGNIVGEHTVRFLGDDEMITLSHQSFSRTLYAKGALQAARWLVSQKPGLYSMDHIIPLFS